VSIARAITSLPVALACETRKVAAGEVLAVPLEGAGDADLAGLVPWP